jgi:hypothetical protein
MPNLRITEALPEGHTFSRVYRLSGQYHILLGLARQLVRFLLRVVDICPAVQTIVVRMAI